jgi:hypothetical protein
MKKFEWVFKTPIGNFSWVRDADDDKTTEDQIADLEFILSTGKNIYYSQSDFEGVTYIPAAVLSDSVVVVKEIPS